MSKQERQYKLLQTLIKEYIKNAHPVSSKTLAQKCGFDCSSATIRNDMVDLEDAGFIAQPHTSAGRIPTEKGYQYYIKHFIHRKELGEAKKEAVEQAMQKQEDDQREKIRRLAKALAELTDETVVVSFGGNSYYTGISRMFRKPEFAEHAELMVSIGEMFDQIDDVMNSMQARVVDDIQILIGQDNPFSSSCSMIVSEYDLWDDGSSLLGILGPMRMDYDTNISIMEYMESLMNERYE